MRRGLACLFVILALLLTACSSTAPQRTSGTLHTTGASTTRPSASFDLTYDMGQYDHFGHIFDEKTSQQWEEMGQFTILLTGFETPVTVQMKGMTVLSVSAYGHSAQVDISTFQDETPANIQGTAGAIVVNETLDYEGSTWVLTADGVQEFHPVGGISTQIFVAEEGALRYRAYWGEYVTSFEQWDTAPLDLCTGRDHFLYENGMVELCSGNLEFVAAERITVSDLYDLDAMFAAAKTNGMYEEFDSVDQLLAFNAQK